MKTFLISLLALSSLTPVFAREVDSWDFDTDEAGEIEEVDLGTVVMMWAVRFERDSSEAINGTVIGGVAGAVIGDAIDDSNTARIAGGVLGAVIGNQIDRKSGRNRGVQIIIKLDDNRTISITQGDALDLEPGCRVCITRGEKARVFRVPDAPVK